MAPPNTALSHDSCPSRYHASPPRPPLPSAGAYAKAVNIVLVALGVVLLYFGAEWLVRNSVVLARAWGLTPMVIGLTVVAFGTSAPELAASLTAALQGAPALALGNVVGSNIANIALILAVSALIAPLATEARFLRREMPIAIGAAALLVALAADGSLSRIEGVGFLLLLAGYLWVLLRTSPEDGAIATVAPGPEPDVPTSSWRAGGLAFVGLVMLVAGSRALVLGASAIARELGVPELVIGVTVVAVGTSLPELATSVLAAARRETDLALGNVVGSNVFNILGILGLTAVARPVHVPFASVAPDLWVMLGVTLLLAPFLVTGRRLGRLEAGTLLVLYVAYVAWRFLA